MKRALLKLRVVLFLGASALLSSCGGGDEDLTPTPLAREVVYTACEESKTALAKVDQSLVDAGVQVYANGCASDGLAVPAVCGIPIHYLRSVEVPKFQEQLARSLGFRAPSEFSSFIPLSCSDI
jgi:hypothetical protein